MPLFLMLVAPEARGTSALSPGALAEQAGAMAGWIERARRSDALRDGFALDARVDRLQFGVDGAPLGGPSTDHGPLRAGFVIEADDVAEARALAASCPAAWPGAVEVIALGATLGAETTRV